LLSTVAALTTALVISATGGRIIEAIIIAALLLPSLAFLVVWIIAWRRGQLRGDPNDPVHRLASVLSPEG
jgi:ABC-type Fe3+-siderophore transport system permease subunit